MAIKRENPMKKLVDVKGGMETLVGRTVVLLCANYFYTGTLTGFNKREVLLEDASVIYETGPWEADSWKDAQRLPGPVYVRHAMIEAYGGWSK